MSKQTILQEVEDYFRMLDERGVEFSEEDLFNYVLQTFSGEFDSDEEFYRCFPTEAELKALYKKI